MIDEINVSVTVRLTEQQLTKHMDASTAMLKVVHKCGATEIERHSVTVGSSERIVWDGATVKASTSSPVGALAIAKFIEAVCEE